MNQYQSFTVEELATDEGFRNWVISPTLESDHLWEQWLIENPGRSGVVARAKELVLAVHQLYNDDLSEDTVFQEIKEITQIAEERLPDRRMPFPTRFIGWAAAMILVSVGMGWLYLRFENASIGLEKVQTYERSSDSLLVKTNTGNKEITVLLSDKSIVTLSPKSTLRYPRQFVNTERKVYLSGEAFFDISKNPVQPFVVYTDEMVTKVLGTSFRIKAFDQDLIEEVSVKTGRVSVYRKKEYDQPDLDPEVASITLNPNQQARYNRRENKLEKGVILNPEMLVESSGVKEQIFDEKPVTEAFDALSKAYGIQIIYKPEVLSNCIINAQFGDENLKQRLNAICQAIGADYDLENERIVIRSQGCK